MSKKPSLPVGLVPASVPNKVSVKAAKYPNILDYLGYIGMHIGCLAVIWTGVTVSNLILCFSLYFVRMFGLMAGYHRYFSHKSFKATRPMQFFLALLGTLSVQKGVLWWAAHHRYHHRYSDTPLDVHSPVQRSFLYSHSGWFLDIENRDTDYTRVVDLAKVPELVWLNSWNMLVVLAFAIAIFAVFGWSGLVWGFFISTILIWHAVHAIGSFGHRFGGYRRFATPDNSRNKWFLGIVMLGEGWHNNHHYYPSSARQGFVWWEIDIAYYILKVLSWFGLVWDLKVPPEPVVYENDPASQNYIRKCKQWLVDLRLSLEQHIGEFTLAQGPFTRDEQLLLQEFIQKTHEHLDRFDGFVTGQLLYDPERLRGTYAELHRNIASEARLLTAKIPHPLADALQNMLKEEIDIHASRASFSHLLLNANTFRRFHTQTVADTEALPLRA